MHASHHPIDRIREINHSIVPAWCHRIPVRTGSSAPAPPPRPRRRSAAPHAPDTEKKKEKREHKNMGASERACVRACVQETTGQRNAKPPKHQWSQPAPKSCLSGGRLSVCLSVCLPACLSACVHASVSTTERNALEGAKPSFSTTSTFSGQRDLPTVEVLRWASVSGHKGGPRKVIQYSSLPPPPPTQFWLSITPTYRNLCT